MKDCFWELVHYGTDLTSRCCRVIAMSEAFQTLWAPTAPNYMQCNARSEILAVVLIFPPTVFCAENSILLAKEIAILKKLKAPLKKMIPKLTYEIGFLM